MTHADRFEKGSGNKDQLTSSGWSLLKEDVSFPIAVLNDSAIDNNARWMQKFSEESGVKLAPHGKTSMAPALFKQQLASGCWGMSLATVPQVVAAYQHGINRIIMANQLVGKYNCQKLVELLKDPEFEFYCFVDSIENIKYLGEFFSKTGHSINILIEIGVDDGRCGWRDFSSVSALTNEIAKHYSLKLAGISFYEGVIHGDNAEHKIVEFISNVKDLYSALAEQDCFNTDDIIITGAGSAWYDLVAKELSGEPLNFIPVIRPGCYLIHDTGIYQDAQHAVIERSALACDLGGDLISSLTVWAYVQSLPEPGLAIVGIGKRDVAFDAGLPTPELYFSPGDDAPSIAPQQWRSLKVMDQHLMLDLSDDTSLKVGDVIAFSTSHPCLTLDKWRTVGIVNDDYVVTKQIETYF